jgi:hypothetical protein
MRLQLSGGAKREFEELPAPLRKITRKQFGFLISNLRHPSLRAKKYDEATGVWQARITRGWLFYFLIVGDVYYIVYIRNHPK